MKIKLFLIGNILKIPFSQTTTLAAAASPPLPYDWHIYLKQRGCQAAAVAESAAAAAVVGKRMNDLSQT